MQSYMEGIQSRSRSKQGKGSNDQKKGMFTSKYQFDDKKPNAKAYLDNSLGNSFGTQLQAQIRNINYGQKTSQQFKQYSVNVQPPKNHVFIKQHSNINQRQNYHLNSSTQEVRKGQHTQVHFNYNSKQHNNSQSPIRYVPINTHQQVIPQQQVQIRRTLVPNKIYNYIPVSSVAQSQTKQQVKHGDQAYQVLMKQYQKLYSKLQREQQQNKQLSILLQKMKNERPKKQVIRERGKISVNMQLLHDKLYAYYQQYVNAILNSHKQRCHGRFQKMFQQAQKQIIITEQVTTTKWMS